MSAWAGCVSLGRASELEDAPPEDERISHADRKRYEHALGLWHLARAGV